MVSQIPDRLAVHRVVSVNFHAWILISAFAVVAQLSLRHADLVFKLRLELSELVHEELVVIHLMVQNSLLDFFEAL